MKLALVSPLPPLPCRAAEVALELMAQLAEAEDVELQVFAHAPEQVHDLGTSFPLHPTADLPHMLRTGEVQVPVYILDDNDYHYHQQRLRQECPGVEVRVDAIDPDAILAAARKHMSAPIGVIEDDRPWPSVETITVAYNSRDIIGPCLQALLDQEYPDLKVTVVDNASTDGTAEYVRAHFPKVNLIVSDRNLGFAGGNNLAFDQTQARYVVLMNQDAIPRRDCIRELVRVAEEDPDIASVGAKMLMRRCPTVINSTGIRINEGGFAVDRQIGEKDTDPCPRPVEVFGVCGGAQLLRTQALRDLGGFDETFFMYFEDVDLCWRLQLAGKRILHAPLAVVHHDWHGDLAERNGRPTAADEVDERTQRRRYLCERNRLQCLFKNYELSSLRGVLPELRRFEKTRISWCDAAIRQGQTPDYFRMVRKAIRSAWRWVWLHLPGLWWRRRRVQALRQRTDAEVHRLIEEGVTEPSHVGDLEIIQDRFSARPGPRIVMGKSDGQSLGPGWYGAEPVPGEDLCTRWSKGEAWFYLRPTQEAKRLHLRVAAGPRPAEYRISCFSMEVGSGRIEDDQLHEISFELTPPCPKDTLVELHLACDTFNPKSSGLGDDHRDLGIRVAEAWLT